MNRKLEVCAVGVLLASGAMIAQDDEWKRLMERGQALERGADYSHAAAAFLDAVKIAQNQELIVALNSVGLVYEELGRFPEAERYFRRALTLLDKTAENNKPDHALLLTNLSLLYREAGQTARSEALLQQAIAIETEALPPDDARLTLARAIGGAGFDQWKISGRGANVTGIAGSIRTAPRALAAGNWNRAGRRRNSAPVSGAE
jgi:tetratricopeptide (TPR) repeat protein